MASAPVVSRAHLNPGLFAGSDGLGSETQPTKGGRGVEAQLLAKILKRISDLLSGIFLLLGG